jgi:hypothetical protein
VTYVEGVCADPNQVRKQTCSQTCTRQAPEPCAAQPLDVLTAPQTAGGTVSGLYSLSATRTIANLPEGSCPATSGTKQVSYHYVRINNPGTEPVNVTLANAPIPPATSTSIDVLLATYVGRTTPPATVAEREACTGAVVDNTISGTESVTVNIPAGGSVILLTTPYAAGKTGQIRVEVTTNFVGAEQAPPVDTDVTLSATMGTSVTAPVSFVTTQTLPRLVTFGGCPASLSTTNTSYRYIRVINPTATARTADVSLASGTDSVIASYPVMTPPLNSDRLNCSDVNDTCSGISGADSCVKGITVPANGSVIVYAAKFSSGAGSTTFKATTTN